MWQAIVVIDVWFLHRCTAIVESVAVDLQISMVISSKAFIAANKRFGGIVFVFDVTHPNDEDAIISPI